MVQVGQIGPRISAVLLVVAVNFSYGMVRATESTFRASHSYALVQAAKLMPIHRWGLVFIAVGIILAGTSFASQFIARIGALIGFGVWVWWTVLIAEAAYYDSRASYANTCVFATIALLHLLLLPHYPSKLL